jgi:uncharacterized protein YaiE (UPF0345 family)
MFLCTSSGRSGIEVIEDIAESGFEAAAGEDMVVASAAILVAIEELLEFRVSRPRTSRARCQT